VGFVNLPQNVRTYLGHFCLPLSGERLDPGANGGTTNTHTRAAKADAEYEVEALIDHLTQHDNVSELRAEGFVMLPPNAFLPSYPLLSAGASFLDVFLPSHTIGGAFYLETVDPAARHF
jgi:hypothetical protein